MTAWIVGFLLWQGALAAQSALLGRPTDNSITINAMAGKDLEVYVEYGPAPGKYTRRTAVTRIAPGSPKEIVIDKLRPDTTYYYRMLAKQAGTPAPPGEEHFFHTQRPPGSTFSFAVQADPHLDDGSDPEVYKQTLRNELAYKPDFLIDLGDTFMSDKLPDPTNAEVVRRHLLARSYYDLVCHSVPLFLVLGNHEGESGRRLDGTANNLAVWATRARKLYYPNPEPNSFYTGSSRIEEFVGLRQNYYAWEWGDALFVVLDPFWYTTGGPQQNAESWYWTLGRDQYNWLKQTLGTSESKFKFVFAHNLVGGLDLDGRARGGVEAAPYFEWGGHNADGSWGFNDKRFGWEMPIHQLLVKNNVTIFFHGHDHLYARQTLDDIVYQEVPQPSHGPGRGGNRTAPYGYIHGDISSGSGYLRIVVSPSKVNVDYMRTASERPGGEVARAYTVNARDKNMSASPTSVAGSKVEPAPRQDASRQPGRKGGGRGKGRQPGRGGRSLGNEPPPAGAGPRNTP
jgi:hypothetical protein